MLGGVFLLQRTSCATFWENFKAFNIGQMAPKRKATVASPSFDQDRFVSLDASKRFGYKRAVIPKKGFDMGKDSFPDIVAEIKRRKWETLYEQTNAGIRVIVQKFYANAAEHRSCITKVHAQNVSFTRIAINSCFKLPNIDKDELATLENAPDYDDVLKVLCTPGTDWIWHKEELKCLKTQTMSVSTKAWSYFLNAHLMPVSHHRDIMSDQAVLLYAIIKGLSIDVGRVIRYSI
ncbi:hypothetical protein TorRG33x02_323690 [Trema orientale]|uniref:Putative plant transposon protein domain-containing protein n=1 Tax=Trema orientale TaxID=63057 RepID=A0A2P5BEU1_TREOI|nr:hypothetical protein TorRG33x02_323690 [Trema orientale]